MTNIDYYVVEIQSNHKKLEFKTPKRVLQCLKDGYEIEPNVNLWGLKKTIEDCGRACFYEVGNTSDWIDGVITLACK